MDGVGDTEALTRLEEVITRAQTLVAQQLAGVMLARTATAQRAQIRRVLKANLLRYLEAAGAIAARGNVELAVEFRFPRKVSYQAFLATARRMWRRRPR